MDAVDQKILNILANGPCWARSLQHAKPYVQGLIDVGLVERVRPTGGHARNMLALTDLGKAAIAKHG